MKTAGKLVVVAEELEVLKMEKEVVEVELNEGAEEGSGKSEHKGGVAAWAAVLSVVEEMGADLREWQQRTNFEGVEFLEWSLEARDRLKSVWDLVDCGDWRVEMEVEAWRGRRLDWKGGQLLDS